MHEILLLENLLNVVGIVLQIIGFVLLLPGFTGWFQERISKLNKLVIGLFAISLWIFSIEFKFVGTHSENIIQHSSGVEIKVLKRFPLDLQVKYSHISNLHDFLNHMRNLLGIIFVIIGLFFYILSQIFHS